MNKSSADLHARVFQFSLRIIKLKRRLVELKEFDLGSQLFRSATSIGANYEEASSAISKADFISKVSISAKEASETLYWLRLIKESDEFQLNVDDLVDEASQLRKIFRSIVQTAQVNQKKQLAESK
ncbi:MAG: four helix bundle protein [Flavobacteriales bacterium]|jgi:four helix bundle protein